MLGPGAPLEDGAPPPPPPPRLPSVFEFAPAPRVGEAFLWCAEAETEAEAEGDLAGVELKRLRKRVREIRNMRPSTRTASRIPAVSATAAGIVGRICGLAS